MAGGKKRSGSKGKSKAAGGGGNKAAKTSYRVKFRMLARSGRSAGGSSVVVEEGATVDEVREKISQEHNIGLAGMKMKDGKGRTRKGNERKKGDRRKVVDCLLQY